MPAHVPHTEPYPWPYDGRLAGPHLALVLAGWDAVWCQRCGDAPAPGSAGHLLAAAVAAAGGETIALAHQGAAPLDPIGPRTMVAAAGIDGFYGSALDAHLRSRGITHLLLAGHGLEGPVHSTLRSANDRGYECLLVTDACSSLVAELTAPAAKTVTMSGGIFGAIGSTADVIAALAATAPSTPSAPVTAQEA